jgi:hypothetical protein
MFIDKIELVICTTRLRPIQLRRCLESFYKSSEKCGLKIIERVYVDNNPSRNLSHIVQVRNLAVDTCEEKLALLCDDDDYVVDNHINVLLSAYINNPKATVVMSQAFKDDKNKPIGFSLSCSLINVERFKMLGWLCPPEGGEDFFTLSTLQARGHLIVKCPYVTWKVCDDTPSLTRDERIELNK